jgi:hypothetical protein
MQGFMGSSVGAQDCGGDCGDSYTIPDRSWPESGGGFRPGFYRCDCWPIVRSGQPDPFAGVVAGLDPAIRASRGAAEEIQMTSFDDDLKRAIRRNKLLGMWAAEKLGLAGADVKTYSDALALDTLDPERSDVFSKIRKDFDAAGVVQSNEQILSVMNELLMEAVDPNQAPRGDALDAAALTIAKNLTR